MAFISTAIPPYQNKLVTTGGPRLPATPRPATQPFSFFQVKEEILRTGQESLTRTFNGQSIINQLTKQSNIQLRQWGTESTASKCAPKKNSWHKRGESFHAGQPPDPGRKFPVPVPVPFMISLIISMLKQGSSNKRVVQMQNDAK